MMSSSFLVSLIENLAKDLDPRFVGLIVGSRG